MNAVITFQIFAIVIILLAGLGAGFFARRLKGSERSEFFLSLGNTFGGGIFLGAGLIHMLPDSFRAFADLYNDIDYPIAAVISGCGFLLILLLEKVFIPAHEHPGVGHHDAPLQLYPYVLMLVLSVHSVIAGVALGAEQQLAEASIVFIAVIAHKGSAAFALGTTMLRSRFKLSQFNRLIIVFSLMTPGGILAGLVLTQLLTGTAEQRFEAVFDALASGTFFYIATLDILQDEFTRPEQRRAKYALVAIGFALMAVIAVWM